tara:strand:- start:1203 stop:1799 length:597 start_codon:yes stop_codon:yes gene_type:complete
MDKRINNIDNFIAVFDNYLPKSECDKAIDLFEKSKTFNQTLNRFDFEQSSVNDKNDEQLFCNPGNLNFWWDACRGLIYNVRTAFDYYNKKTGICTAYDEKTFHFTDIKIQKTLPGEGYHVWHIEHSKGYENEKRALVFAIYLNDVEEGGETEFLHFSKRVEPKSGRIIMWPAAFPYVHRGNPPLKGEKYILTSWLVLR